MLDTIIGNLLFATPSRKVVSGRFRRFIEAARKAKEDDEKDLAITSCHELHQERSALNDRILTALATSTASDTNCETLADSQLVSDWLRKLKTGCLQSLHEASSRVNLDAQQEAAYRAATVQLLDRAMSLLHSYSLPFNQTVGPELHMTFTRPTVVSELLSTGPRREPIATVESYRGRLSTRTWSLVARGQSNVIDFLLLPADKVIGLSRAEAAFEPICALRASCVDGELQWQAGARPLTNKLLQLLCQDLFNTLVRHSTGEVQNGQLIQAQATSGEGGKQAPESETFRPAAADSHSFKHRQRIKLDELHPEQDFNRADEPHLLLGVDRSLVPSSTDQAAAVLAVEAEQISAACDREISANPEASFEAGQERHRYLDRIFLQLSDFKQTLEQQLDCLASAGAQAFRCHDFVEVQALSASARAHEEMLKQVTVLHSCWQSLKVERLPLKVSDNPGPGSRSAPGSVTISQVVETISADLEKALDAWCISGAESFLSHNIGEVARAHRVALQLIAFRDALRAVGESRQGAQESSGAVVACQLQSPAIR